MPRLEILPAARADFAEILEYSIAQFGEDVADQYMRGFYDAFDRLIERPQIGPLVPNITGDRRMLRHRSHFIFYRVIGDGIRIIRVLHTARDAAPLLN